MNVISAIANGTVSTLQRMPPARWRLVGGMQLAEPPSFRWDVTKARVMCTVGKSILEIARGNISFSKGSGGDSVYFALVTRRARLVCFLEG